MFINHDVAAVLDDPWLQDLSSRFKFRQALLLGQLEGDWVVLLADGLPQEVPWTAEHLPLETLASVAEQQDAKVYAEAAGNNALAFLGGAPLKVSLLAWTEVAQGACLGYLSRPLGEGLYTEEDLADFKQRLSTLRWRTAAP